MLDWQMPTFILFHFPDNPPSSTIPRSIENAKKALEIDNTISDAYVRLLGISVCIMNGIGRQQKNTLSEH